MLNVFSDVFWQKPRCCKDDASGQREAEKLLFKPDAAVVQKGDQRHCSRAHAKRQNIFNRYGPRPDFRAEIAPEQPCCNWDFGEHECHQQKRENKCRPTGCLGQRCQKYNLNVEEKQQERSGADPVQKFPDRQLSESRNGKHQPRRCPDPSDVAPCASQSFIKEFWQ